MRSIVHRHWVWCSLIVLLAGAISSTAHASALSEISGASWPTSGSVSSGATSGLAAASGLTYVPATDPPPGSKSIAYLESTAGSAASFQVDATGRPLTGSQEREYWLRLWVRPVRTTAALPSTTQAYTKFWAASSSSELNVTAYFPVNTSAYASDGFSFVLTDTKSGTTAQDLNQTTSQSQIAFNSWNEITIHATKASSGLFEMFINGQMVFQRSVDTTGITWGSMTNGFALPAANGWKWQIAGPIQSFTDSRDLVTRPHWELNGKNPDLHRIYHGVGLDRQHGGHFTSTGSWTRFLYANSGDRPQRYGLSCAAAATLTTIEDVGQLPFNEVGWATIGVSDFLVPNNGVLSFTVQTEAGAAAATFTVTGGNLTYGGNTLAAVANNKWYALLIHVSAAGEMNWTMFDLTADFTSTQTAFSGTLGSGFPTRVGKLKVDAAPGDGGDIKVGHLAVMRWCDLTGVDSWSSTSANGVSPVLTVPCTHVPLRLPHLEEIYTIPGGTYAQQNAGLNRRHIFVCTGRSGKKRADWTTNVLGKMTYTRGCRMACIDLGSINDLMAITDATTYRSVIDGLVDNLGTMCNVLLPYNKIWAWTMMPRGRALAITGVANNGSGLCRVTANGHDWIDGDIVDISGVIGVPNANGRWVVTGKTANTIDLTSSSFAGTYVSGGTIVSGSGQSGTVVVTNLRRQAVLEYNRLAKNLFRQKQRYSGTTPLITLSDVADAIFDPTVVYDVTWGTVHANPAGDLLIAKTGVQSETPVQPTPYATAP